MKVCFIYSFMQFLLCESLDTYIPLLSCLYVCNLLSFFLFFVFISVLCAWFLLFNFRPLFLFDLFLSHCSSDFISFLFISPLSAPSSVVYMLQRNQTNRILNLRLLPISYSGCLLLSDVDFSVCEIYKQRAQGILWSTVLNIACQPESFPANQSRYITNGYFLRYLITLSPCHLLSIFETKA